MKELFLRSALLGIAASAILISIGFSEGATSSSTSFYSRGEVQSVSGLPSSTSFKAQGIGGQNAPGITSSTDFRLDSGAIRGFFAPLRPIYSQIHYHWRNDDGSEALATSATGGVEDAPLSSVAKGSVKRLRLEVTNAGGTVKGFTAQQFRLEYALGPTCSSGSYADVGAVGGDWDMATSSTNLTEGGDTTNVSVSLGGVSDANSSFFAPNGGQRKTASQTGNLTLPSDKFVELEYAVTPLASATTTAPYCFRVTNAGSTADFSYSIYATATIASANSAPTVSGALLNGGNSITLLASSTQNVSVGFTVSDADGCSDVFTGGGVTTTIFRSGAGASCAANNQNCYITGTVSSSCSGGTSATATATIPLYYFAQATDASSTFPAENWQAKIVARDANGAIGSSTSSGVELNTLLAINLSSGGLNYGTVGAGSNTGSSNQSFSVSNVGNSSSTLQISGTALYSGSNLIATSSQHYATSSFTYGAGDTQLSAVLSSIAGFFLTSPTSTSSVFKNLFWGIAAPPGNPAGTYLGTTTIVAVFSS